MTTDNPLSMVRSESGRRWVATALRVTLAAAFLSAVADRFGLWGRAGDPAVAWGNYDAFLEYTRQLLPMLPHRLADILGATATLLEVVLAVWLLSGARAAWAGLSSAALLLLFATAMILALGLKAVLDYNVLTALAAAAALASYVPAGKSALQRDAREQGVEHALSPR